MLISVKQCKSIGSFQIQNLNMSSFFGVWLHDQVYAWGFFLILACITLTILLVYVFVFQIFILFDVLLSYVVSPVLAKHT